MQELEIHNHGSYGTFLVSDGTNVAEMLPQDSREGLDTENLARMFRASPKLLSSLETLIAEIEGMDLEKGAREGDDLGGGPFLDAMRSARDAVRIAKEQTHHYDMPQVEYPKEPLLSLEIRGVVDEYNRRCETFLCRPAKPGEDPQYWSVYGELSDGRHICLADRDTKEAAETRGEQLAEELGLDLIVEEDCGPSPR